MHSFILKLYLIVLIYQEHVLLFWPYPAFLLFEKKILHLFLDLNDFFILFLSIFCLRVCSCVPSFCGVKKRALNSLLLQITGSIIQPNMDAGN